MTEDTNIRFVRLFKRLDSYITSVCLSFGRGFYHITASDLKQDCAEKLLTIMHSGRYDLSDFQLVELFKTTVYNLLRDQYRFHSLRKHDRLQHTTNEDGETETTDVPAEGEIEDNTIFEQYRQQILAKLETELERRLFDLLLSPDRNVIALMQMRNGKAVILKSSYAAVLGVSAATISRATQKIQTTTLGVLAGDKVD